MSNKRFIRINPEIYQHPFDRNALTSLEKMPGLSFLMKKVNEYGIDRILRLQTLGSQFKVTPTNFPNLYNIFSETCNILDVTPLPELYLAPGMGQISTYTIGVDKPIISINLEAMEWLTNEELYFVLGHELIRVKNKYIVYQQMAQVMPTIKALISNTTLGLGGIASNGLELALVNWIVMSKFTADRSGLLACQNLEVAITALMKLGGLPAEYLTEDTINDFEEQARSFMKDNLDNISQVTKIFSFVEFRLPWVVMRMAELFKWVDSGDYQSLLDTGKLPEKAADVPLSKDLSEESSDDSSEWDFLSKL
ncbi:peptidase M48 [Oscillatoriales cyanobacterium USR001]|nr:peptidase M48 [Oscillatoriales cyanobacterium USR001]